MQLSRFWYSRQAHWAALALFGGAAAAASAQPAPDRPPPARTPGGPPAVTVADPAATAGQAVDTTPQPGDVLEDGMTELPGGTPWPTVEATTGGSTATTVDAEVRYTVGIEGLAPLGLQDQFRSLSSLWTKRGSPANLAQINRRTVEDRDLIEQLLRSAGYYGGTTAAVITAPTKNGDPVKVVLTATPGERYTFDAVTLSMPDGAAKVKAEAALGLQVGDPIDAVRVSTATTALPLKLAEAGYPFPTVGEPAITVDHGTRTAQLTLTVDAGPRGLFGRARFGDDTSQFSDRHLALLARRKRGEIYDAADVEDLRRALIQTGLFGAVSIKPTASGPPNPDGSQYVDLVVTTESAPLRTIATTLGYSTGQGLRAEASWQHRNLIRPEGAFTVRTVAAEREQLLGVELRRRNFRRRDQTLVLNSEASSETKDAYTATSFGVGAAIARETNIIWQKKWTYSLGVELLATRQRDRSAPTDPNNLFLIAALPANLTYDGSDDLLDPASGFRLTGRASPEFSLQGGTTLAYAKLQVEGSFYQPFGNIVLAARGHLGAIAGASRGRIAPSRRFYAGGGGSVRGFGYQAVGPQDADGAPLGGNSITEASIEARFRFKAFGNDIGLVPFVDVGQVYTSTLPRFDSLRVGAGLGLRYYTSFGPIRVDVATPITKGPRDPRLAFYVSIGQAF